ncbi:unnamed protein product [Effrenium voratum]|uniref:Uncharacterized protein n=1 Tax=Effrenium voratum TaxID=2562239 RepID=A0AA36I7H5_9DINO|nr:unnamed protein product [Effrenium voratum]CAJ1429610.1 unnamed protein product [Effrenium voratum]
MRQLEMPQDVEDGFGARQGFLCCDNMNENVALLNSRLKEKTVKYQNSNKIVFGHIMLALSTATIMVLFGLPLFSSHIRHAVFGHDACAATAIGLYMNNGTEEEPNLIKIESFSDVEASKLYNCGLIPRTYKAYWPNVCQFCFFSLLTNTGKTVQATLQGLIGTFIATLNVWVLYEIWPHASQMEECPSARLAAGDCVAGEMVYKDPNFIPAAAFAEAILFSMLWLVSSAPKNMIMFMLSYHVVFMSNFLNPYAPDLSGELPMGFLDLKWDSNTTIVNLTSLLGGILAILATLVPNPLLNARSLVDNSTIAVQGLHSAWSDALDYFTGTEKVAKRYQIASKMDAIKGALDRTEESINGAWFEHFDLGHFGVARELFRLFCQVGHKNQKLVQISKAALVREQFDGRHNQFVDGIKQELTMLNASVAKLFGYCVKCCADGAIDQQEREQLKDLVAETKGREKDLAKAYRNTMKAEHFVSEDLANENCFIYGFAAYVRSIVDFAEGLPVLADEKKKNTVVSFFKSMCSTIGDLFSLDVMTSSENLKFAVVNFLPVMSTFAIAYFAQDSSLFVPHAALMPSTLALIITSSYGSTFKGNIDRLIGLVLGNVLPLLVLAIVFIFDCSSMTRTILQSGLVWLYFFTFSYVYYSSKTWSFVGCALCGFGAYPLMVSCSSGGEFHYNMRSNYQVIAQTTVAVLIRMLIETILLDKAPRDLAVDQLQELLDTIKDAYEDFFDGDYEEMKKQHEQAGSIMASCDNYHSETAPALEVAPGLRLSFKHKFYGDVLAQLKLALAEMGVLVTGASTWASEKIPEETSTIRQDLAKHEGEKHLIHDKATNLAYEEVHSIMNRHSSFLKMKDDLLQTCNTTFELVIALLKQDKEEALEEVKESFAKLSKLGGLLELDGVHDFYTEVNEAMASQQEDTQPKDSVILDMQARLTVVVNSLKNATAALGEIGVLCLRENIY